jgi:hypothetical protein
VEVGLGVVAEEAALAAETRVVAMACLALAHRAQQTVEVWVSQLEVYELVAGSAAAAVVAVGVVVSSVAGQEVLQRSLSHPR